MAQLNFENTTPKDSINDLQFYCFVPLSKVERCYSEMFGASEGRGAGVTMRCRRFDAMNYADAGAAKKRGMHENLAGVGELNQSQLSRVLSYAPGCGLADIASIGSNSKFCRGLCNRYSLREIAVKINPFLWTTIVLQNGVSMTQEEIQMDLCASAPVEL